MMALSRDRSLSIAAKVDLGAEELSKPCEECLFPLLANFVHPWRLVFSSLLSEVDLDDIDKESQSEQEKRVASLRKWKTRNGHKANYGVLVKAILDNGKVDQAELLCQLLTLQPPSDDQGTTTKTSTVSCEILESTSPQSSLPFHPSPTPPLSTTIEHLSPGTSSLDEEIYQLDKEYTEIESLVLETIKHHKVSHKTMLKWVQILPINLKPQFSEVLQRNAKALCNATSVDELFMIISPYWNSLHPTLLVHLVEQLADDRLKAQMKRYINKLNKFRIHTRLGDFVEKWAGGVPPGFDEFVLELGEEWRERTVEDFEQFRIRLSRQQCIGGHMIYMKKMTPGSIFVELALPQCCFPLTFNRDMQKFLREEDVLGVFVGGLCILDLRLFEEQVSDSQSSDEDWESETEAEAVAVSGTTGLGDSETDQSSVYSDEIDSDCIKQIHVQPRPNDRNEQVAEGDVIKAHDISSTFPSLASLHLRFLFRSLDGISITSSQGHGYQQAIPRFRMTPLRRTGEVELQIEIKPGASPKGIEIGLERCTLKSVKLGENCLLGSIIPLAECSCVFSVLGAVFNYLKRNSSININYPEDKLLLSQGVNRIGLKITRDGALEFVVNGQSLGIAAEAVYKSGILYGSKMAHYPVLWMPIGSNKATLIAGASQTEVLGLQQLCIDKVAENLLSPEAALYLPLPNSLKEKIANVVFDPDNDFCYDYFSRKYKRYKNSDIVDHNAYIGFLSTVR